MAAAETLTRSRPFMRTGALVYLYRRRLRVHAVQELLAGLGVAIGVALVFATILAAASIAGSADEVVNAVIGPASLQLRARGSSGFDESLLRAVERLRGVKQAAPLLEQTATIASANGRTATVDLAGADTSLVVLDGLAHTLPTSTLSAGGIGVSRATAIALGMAPVDTPTSAHNATDTDVSVAIAGRTSRLKVSAVLGPETFGALSQARVAVMPLAQLQRLAGLPRRISRVLVQTQPGTQTTVERELTSVAAGGVDVVSANQDVQLLRQALRPSDEASAFFAAISALLGFLFAATALLLTVPERRKAIAELRLNGAKRSAIVQLFLFQALLLGLAASALGVLCGYILSLGAFHQSTGYLAEAFTLGTRTIVTAQPLAIALIGGVLATCLASAAPLIDLRPGRTLDAIYRHEGEPGYGLSASSARTLAASAAALTACATALFVTSPSHALIASGLLALATVLAVPPAFAWVLRAAAALGRRRPRMTILPVALSSLKATTLRSLALAATGGLALFGSVALGGARGDLLRGIERFAHSYSSDAPVWVGNPGDNQATVALGDGTSVERSILRAGGVLSASPFQGGFTALGQRRVWIIAREAGAERHVLDSQIAEGSPRLALRRLDEGGWIAISKQIADEHHVSLGGELTLPTPSGPASLRVAATTTNLAWSPGVIFMSNSDYSRLWKTDRPTAYGVRLMPNTPEAQGKRSIERALGGASGLEVLTARERERRIDSLTSEGLAHLGDISLLLLIAAVLSLSAALTSAIWQRRSALAGLRLAGVRPRRLRLILLVESALMLSAGCATGALAGIYGQLVIDGYLQQVTGFPIAHLGARLRPLQISLLVVVIVLAIVALPGWRASRVSPRIALNE